jgi:hypothetical protein
MPGGSWSLAEALFQRGDVAFVAELRCVHDAERLAGFAARWLADNRPAARQLLIEYLSGPLNAYRHEALVKRLFKGAEKAGDDTLMGLFLVAFDRSVRRERKKITRRKWEQPTTRAEADSRLKEWSAEGYVGNISNYSGRFYVFASKEVEAVVARQNAMPRPHKSIRSRNVQVPDSYRLRLEKRFVLFRFPTRRYLRRRAWRYFRKLGKSNPERYRAAAVEFLQRYSDAEVDTDIHLLDNWGLVHALFFNSSALIRPAKGWELAEGRSLADLAPAPRFPDVWKSSPQVLLDLLTLANCRTVRQFAAWMLRAHHRDWLDECSITILLRLVDHADPDVSSIGFELIERHRDLASVPIEAWLARLDSEDLVKLQRLSALLSRRLDPALMTLADIVKVASHRSLPVAQLGFSLLRRIALTEDSLPALFPLLNADCESLRPELAGWLREALLRVGTPRAEWLLEFVDSKHADVRAIGWKWLQESALKDEPGVWHKLLETPYDDIKGPLVKQLARRVDGADLGTVRLLWASVLLSIQRGGRQKPGVVAQVVSRLVGHPGETNQLLPLLAVAVRSLRGPEFRTGLAGVVALLENAPELMPAIATQFPELVT